MRSFNFEFVVLDDRVAQKLVTGFIELAARGFPVGAVQFDFQIFAYVDRVDAAVAHVLERVLHRFALRINDGFFRSNDDPGFHVKAGPTRAMSATMLGKAARGREFFLAGAGLTAGTSAIRRARRLLDTTTTGAPASGPAALPGPAPEPPDRRPALRPRVSTLVAVSRYVLRSARRNTTLWRRRFLLTCAPMAANPDPDAGLMLRVKRGDREAFELLVDKYKQPVTNVIYRTLGDATEAEDLAQNVFVQVYKSAH